MKQLIKFAFFLTIGLVVFLVVMAKVGLHNIADALALFFNLQGLAIIGLTVIFIVLGIVKWRLILKSYGHSFSLKELGPLWLLGFSLSYITPFAVVGGEIFRVYFTRKKFPEIPSKKVIASVAVDKILDATVFFVFLIIGLLVFGFYGRLPSSFFGVSVTLTAGGFLALLVFFYFRRWQKKSALEWLLKRFGINREDVTNGQTGQDIFEAEKYLFSFFSFRHWSFWQGLFLTILRYVTQFLRAVLLIFFLAGSVGVLKSLAVYGFANLATLTPLPATLGALELGEGFVFKVLGLGFDTGTVFAMIWRGADLIITLFGLIFVIQYGAIWVQEKILKTFNKK